MILDQNVEQRFHNINSDPVSTHWNLVSTHTHAMRLTQNETRNINFQFGTKHNSDTTEAQELLTTKLSDKAFQSSVLLRAYSGLFGYLSWKKCKLQLEKKDLDVEDPGGWSHEAEGGTMINLKQQMDFQAKRALVLFGDLVEHDGLWDIFITKQVDMLKYYDKSDEARKILERYKEKNPENPNTHR